jgi:hypothetical protein
VIQDMQYESDFDRIIRAIEISGGEA